MLSNSKIGDFRCPAVLFGTELRSSAGWGVWTPADYVWRCVIIQHSWYSDCDPGKTTTELLKIGTVPLGADFHKPMGKMCKTPPFPMCFTTTGWGRVFVWNCIVYTMIYYNIYNIYILIIIYWLVVWNMAFRFPLILGMSSSLTFTPSFFRGVGRWTTIACGDCGEAEANIKVYPRYKCGGLVFTG